MLASKTEKNLMIPNLIGFIYGEIRSLLNPNKYSKNDFITTLLNFKKLKHKRNDILTMFLKF